MKPGVTTRGTRPEWVPLVNGLIRTIRELIVRLEVADSCEMPGTNYWMHGIASWKNTILFGVLLVAWVWSIRNHIFWNITCIVLLRNHNIKFSCISWLKMRQYDLQCTWGPRVCQWDNSDNTTHPSRDWNKATVFLVQSHAAEVSLLITSVLLECTLNGRGFCSLWK
jgi:hypothetical protein